jgi:hypothetical protein
MTLNSAVVISLILSMQSGAILTKDGANSPCTDCNRLRSIARNSNGLQSIALNGANNKDPIKNENTVPMFLLPSFLPFQSGAKKGILI